MTIDGSLQFALELEQQLYVTIYGEWTELDLNYTEVNKF